MFVKLFLYNAEINISNTHIIHSLKSCVYIGAYNQLTVREPQISHLFVGYMYIHGTHTSRQISSCFSHVFGQFAWVKQKHPNADIIQPVCLILNADWLKAHSSLCLFHKIPPAKSMMLKCLFTYCSYHLHCERLYISDNDNILAWVLLGLRHI